MKIDYDVAIIGGGVAGMSAAQYSSRANLSTLVIEELAPGGQALIIDRLENYPGLSTPVSGYDFSESMRTQALAFGSVFKNTSVESIEKKDEIFNIKTSEGMITAKAVIIATGAKHRMLDVPGETEFSGRGVSYCATCDGPFFKGKKILVVGGGDSACDEAMFLSKLTETVVMVHRRDRFRAQKAIAERVLKNPRIKVLFNTVVKRIEGEAKVSSVVLENVSTSEQLTESFDAVFVFVGSIPQTSMLPDLEKDDSGSIITDQFMNTSVKGLFAAGDVRATPFRQVVTAASDGAIAAHSASQYIDEIEGSAYI